METREIRRQAGADGPPAGQVSRGDDRLQRGGARRGSHPAPRHHRGATHGTHRRAADLRGDRMQPRGRSGRRRSSDTAATWSISGITSPAPTDPTSTVSTRSRSAFSWATSRCRAEPIPTPPACAASGAGRGDIPKGVRGGSVARGSCRYFDLPYHPASCDAVCGPRKSSGGEDQRGRFLGIPGRKSPRIGQRDPSRPPSARKTDVRYDRALGAHRQAGPPRDPEPDARARGATGAEVITWDRESRHRYLTS